MLATLRRHFHALVDSGALRFSDPQSKRYVARNEKASAAPARHLAPPAPAPRRLRITPITCRRAPRRVGRPGLGPRSSPHRSIARPSHASQVSRLVHEDLTPLVSLLAGRAVAPTYTYFSGYVAGSELPLHTDRDDCEYTVSYLLQVPR